MDKLSSERRSENMRSIRGKDTLSELAVRRLCRELGFSGYRIHRKELPGKPDIVWLGRKLTIFVHGCFWHGHDCSEGLRKPKSNRSYWIPKIKRNQQRDAENISTLREAGWNILVIWECETKEQRRLSRRLSRFLTKNRPTSKSSRPAKSESLGIY
jgi:DNA mismatch endonuclease (patch repair protein)